MSRSYLMILMTSIVNVMKLLVDLKTPVVNVIK